MRTRTLIRRLGECARVASHMFTREDFRLAKAYAALDTDIYEIRTQAEAAYYALSWPGRPFVIHGDAHYGEWDVYSHIGLYLFHCWYILSGQYDRDRCIDTDFKIASEQLFLYSIE